MSLEIAIILSVVLQFLAAIIALSLVKRTKSNIAWWLISFAFLLMAFRRLFELFEIYNLDFLFINTLTNNWIGVSISLVMLLSLVFIKRIFNIQKRFDNIKKENESKVFSCMIKTEEKQKQLFSKELHDGLGPILSAIKMSISHLIKKNPNSEDIKILKNTENLIDESIISIKEISNNLSPHLLESFGIVKALKSFVRKLEDNNEINIQINTNIKALRFNSNIETVVYRILCELLNNTLKHAEANNIYIDIIKEKGTLNIKYLDDGKGFDYNSETDKLQGLGITNIISRIKSINGSAQIFSQEKEGFNANFVINLK
jgi:signal transduction histidine kinase